MSLIVRPLDVDADRGLVVDLVCQNLNPLADERRYDWLYRDGPFGRAVGFIALDSEESAPVGLAAAFPRRAYLSEREETVWVLGDFCIREPFRTLGPAMKLQRACLAGLASAGAVLSYDFPSATMAAIYHRLGVKASFQTIRLAKPLRLDRKVGEWLGSSGLARNVSAGASILMALGDRRTSTGLTVGPHEGTCRDEFTALARKAGPSHALCTLRSSDYLNWRFGAHPLRSHEMMTVRRGTELLAYAAFTCQGDNASIADLFGVSERTVLDVLIGAVSAVLRERGVVTLSVAMGEFHPWLGQLARAGFHKRESHPVYVCRPPSRAGDVEGPEGRGWFLADGERES